MNRMITRRKYVSITMMMLVLLFMFQFTQVIKDVDNDYHVNEYAEKSTLTGSTEWKMEQINTPLHNEKNEYVVFLGRLDSPLGNIVKQWCQYTKRNIKVYSAMDEMLQLEEIPPEVVLIDSGYVDFSKETYLFFRWAKSGISTIFCNLPDVNVIAKNGKIREVLGIKSVEAYNVELEGVKLFGGFLLGGDTIYAVEEEEQQKRQDLDLEIPWYVAFGGTKTYMVGMVDEELIKEEEHKNEYLPAIIWRNSLENANVFAVNGDYMTDSTGLGILSAMMSELHSYEIYPVINAQNITVANFPGFAEENTETIMRLYSRDQSDLFRDIMWPSINATMMRNQLHETVFFMAQADYTDTIEPKEDEYVFYLKELNEHKAEAGVSVNSRAKDINLKDKMVRDSAFYEKANNGYVFTAAFADDTESARELKRIIPQVDALHSIKTVIQRYDAGTPIVSYLDKNVTLQNTTSNGVYYTFSQDLRMKSLQTALAYSNTLLDMYPIAWPESPDDVWEKMYDDYSRNIDTFWKKFHVFDNTNASESDIRVRRFLNLNYTDRIHDNVIELELEELADPVWFMLLTNGQEIEKIEGASYKKVEEDAYLLKLQEKTVKVYLQDSNRLYYYMK